MTNQYKNFNNTQNNFGNSSLNQNCQLENLNKTQNSFNNLQKNDNNFNQRSMSSGKNNNKN
jgi:hypothetical protein